MELWARGQHGGEKITIGVGLLGPDKKYPDSARTKGEEIRLEKEWKRYRIRLEMRPTASASSENDQPVIA